MCFPCTGMVPGEKGWAHEPASTPFLDVYSSHEACAKSRLSDLLMAFFADTQGKENLPQCLEQDVP